jgi:inactivated superfamily I helicase
MNKSERNQLITADSTLTMRVDALKVIEMTIKTDRMLSPSQVLELLKKKEYEIAVKEFLEALSSISDLCDSTKSAEEEKYDNLSDNLKNTERASNYQSNAETLEDLEGQYSEIKKNVESAMITFYAIEEPTEDNASEFYVVLYDAFNELEDIDPTEELQ